MPSIARAFVTVYVSYKLGSHEYNRIGIASNVNSICTESPSCHAGKQ